ncbi:MAG: S1C family serine protease [Bacillaceae bacterium]
MRRRSRRSLFFASFAGVIVGGLLVFFTLPFFVMEQQKSNIEVASKKVEPITTQSIKQSDITKAIEKVNDAVIGVISIRQETGERKEMAATTGSGVIYKKEKGFAYIVTNHHVIDGAKQLEVSLPSGKRIPATLLGSDAVTDLALIKIKEAGINVVATLGDSTTLKKGQSVVAIGNPLGLDFSGSATQGIISATNRIIPVDYNKDGHYDWQVEVLQTDAAINPGNSGGALIDSNGQIVGINSMKIAEQEVEGIGFSIPITLAKPIIQELEKSGKIKRPYIGVELRSLSEIPAYDWTETLKLPKEVQGGVCITFIEKDGAASKAKLEKYDVITAINDVNVTSIAQFRKELYRYQINEKIKITVYRSGQKQVMEVVLEEEKY